MRKRHSLLSRDLTKEKTTEFCVARQEQLLHFVNTDNRPLKSHYHRIIVTLRETVDIPQQRSLSIEFAQKISNQTATMNTKQKKTLLGAIVALFLVGTIVSVAMAASGCFAAKTAGMLSDFNPNDFYSVVFLM